MQMASGVTVVLIAGSTVTRTDAVWVHPDELVTVTVYMPDADGVTLETEGVWEEEVNPLGPVQK